MKCAHHAATMRGISLMAFQCSKGFDHTTDGRLGFTKSMRCKRIGFRKANQLVKCCGSANPPYIHRAALLRLGIKRHAISCSAGRSGIDIGEAKPKPLRAIVLSARLKRLSAKMYPYRGFF